MIAALVDALRADNDPHLPLAEANLAGRFGLLCIDGLDVRITPTKLAALDQPYLVNLVTDVGPGRISCAPALRRWAKFSVLHAIAERQNDYRMIVDLVEHHQRVLLVETRASLAGSWMAFLQRGPATMGLIAGMVRS